MRVKKSLSPPKEYTRQGVLALIRRCPVASEAWDEIARTRTKSPKVAEVWDKTARTRTDKAMSLLETVLTNLANVPCNFAAEKRYDWSAVSKRLSRVPARLERAARDLEWACLDSTVWLPLADALLGSEYLEYLLRRFQDGFFGTSGRLRRAANHIRQQVQRKAHMKATRLKDRVALQVRDFLGCLKYTGPLDLQQAADVLQPIYSAIGLKSPTEGEALPNVESLQALLRRQGSRSPLSKSQQQTRRRTEDTKRL